jgi:hypothetical protein
LKTVREICGTHCRCQGNWCNAFAYPVELEATPALILELEAGGGLVIFAINSATNKVRIVRSVLVVAGKIAAFASALLGFDRQSSFGAVR